MTSQQPLDPDASRVESADRRPSLHFHFIGLVVADMARSLAFYRRLGLAVPDGADGEPHVEAPLGDGAILAWDTVEVIRGIDPEWTPPSGSPRAALAFRCADPAEVDRVYGDLVGAGYTGHKQPWDAFWGQRYAVLHDPDGNAVDLFAPNGQG
ncbi:VOC family protein [Rugosimonospora acidiphila]|uniref:VOC family protein n=1 Tax=Rugosimonospora acidiphila TaxID=556531 RepID=A0ABP9RVR5_9ACTN